MTRPTLERLEKAWSWRIRAERSARFRLGGERGQDVLDDTECRFTGKAGGRECS